MSVTQVGIVYYADDPDRKVFRVITPSFDDSELDVPDPEQGSWTVFGVDPTRTAILEKVPLDDPRATFMCNVDDPPTRDGVPI